MTVQTSYSDYALSVPVITSAAGPVDGYQVGRDHRILEWEHARECREYERLFRALELRNAREVSPAEVRRVKRRHLRSPLDSKPLVSTPKEPWRFAKARKRRAEYERGRHRAENPIETRVCPQCGTEHTPRHAQRGYCGARCARLASNQRRGVVA